MTMFPSTIPPTTYDLIEVANKSLKGKQMDKVYLIYLLGNHSHIKSQLVNQLKERYNFSVISKFEVENQYQNNTDQIFRGALAAGVLGDYSIIVDMSAKPSEFDAVQHYLQKFPHQSFKVSVDSLSSRSSFSDIYDSMITIDDLDPQADSLKEESDQLFQQIDSWIKETSSLASEEQSNIEEMELSSEEDDLSEEENTDGLFDALEAKDPLYKTFREACLVGQDFTSMIPPLESLYYAEEETGKEMRPYIVGVDRTDVHRPFAHNEVTCLGNKTGASHIRLKRLYDGFNDFIASPAPRRHEEASFWSMVFHSDVEAIVMLTPLEEHGRTICFQYWPRLVGEEKLFGKISMKCTQSDLIQQGTQESLFCSKLVLQEGDHQKIVYHYWIKDWIDAKGISDFNVLSETMRYLKGHVINNPEMKTLVHCAAGIGRTGTFIAAYMLEHFQPADVDSGSVEEVNRLIFEIVVYLRSERHGLVQSPDQYQNLVRWVIHLMKSNLGESSDED